MKTAVIGAGVAGLVAARELKREGHKVTVFEKSSKIGGTWVYNPRIESDPISIDPTREIVHSSLYYSLRTNLPRDLMGFSDYPFLIRENGDPRNYPGHEEFLLFLNDFARDFEITEMIRFNTEVIGVERSESGGGGWSVVVRGGDDQMGLFETEVFEGVVICNGHQTIPNLADPLGIENWKGKQIHSHNYRLPQPFLDQVIVMIGNGPSAMDISKDVATVAKEVHLSSRSRNTIISKLNGYDNMWQHSEIDFVDDERGAVVFKDGSTVYPDVIFHCTGYKFNFPFLKTNGIVTIDDNRVGPLYKHVFAPEFGPSLSFIGLNNFGISCRIIELQARWIAKILSGFAVLPSKEEMVEDVKEYYKTMEENGIAKHHTHRLPWNKSDYIDWLANEVGIPPVEDRLKQMFCDLITMALSNSFSISELRDS